MIFEYCRFVLPAIAIIVLLGCCSSLFHKRPKTKTVAFLVNTKTNDAIPLHYWETSIGRSSSCDIVLDYPTVSRFHAVISRRKNTWIVSDTGSKTHVFLNEEKVDKRSKLNDGDEIRFGDASYYFSAPDFGDQVDAEYFPALVSQNNGKVFYIENDSCMIGRDPKSDVYLNISTVSRKHAEIFMDDGHWYLKNYSSNGVYINDKVMLDTRRLKAGDVLDIGGAKIIFEER
ncbi:hypothetical protein SDC9_160901 [bioreactor metagenome]|uniref:FHA domain-containing protein n=1 Tax=bioreactor metagenome TaxID=1076179 RepID=A0A645FJR1_9ZZZZ